MATKTQNGRRDTNGAGSAASNGSHQDRSAEPASAPPLDTLLSEATAGPVQRWVPGRTGVRAAARLVRRPRQVARRGAGLVAELGKVAVGRSELEPSKSDRRFKDPAWQQNPAYRRVCQSYLAAGETLDALVCDAGLAWAEERRMRFAVENLVAALAPTNFPLGNPAVLKAALDTGGLNFVRGLRHFVSDMASRPRIPSMVDGTPFEVGENLAVTPGAVVLRTDVFELLQYEPQTDEVRELPLLMVPPMINKYYIADMAPKRSMIEHLVGGGQQVFAISWRNPGEQQSEWGLDTYVQAVLEALEAIEKVAGCDQVHAAGLCAGGIVLSIAAAHLAARGEPDRLAGLTLGVCVLDNSRAGTTSAFVDRRSAALAVADSARRGYLDGRALAGVFAWLRPNDLIWSYWVNNYLLGKDPPAFDVLYWNSDTTNLPAELHRDFMELSLENSLVHPGRLESLGTPIDLSQITVDTYLVAGISDHITPWQSNYRTTQLLGSEPRFVLSNSGHIAAMVNPPDNEKASFQVGEENPPEAEEWLEQASKRRGSWWVDWLEWLGERSGEEKAAPDALGGGGLEPLEPAPGSYVRVTH